MIAQHVSDAVSSLQRGLQVKATFISKYSPEELERSSVVRARLGFYLIGGGATEDLKAEQRGAVMKPSGPREKMSEVD